jgi:hypothetical protein
MIPAAAACVHCRTAGSSQAAQCAAAAAGHPAGADRWHEGRVGDLCGVVIASRRGWLFSLRRGAAAAGHPACAGMRDEERTATELMRYQGAGRGGGAVGPQMGMQVLHEGAWVTPVGVAVVGPSEWLLLRIDNQCCCMRGVWPTSGCGSDGAGRDPVQHWS